MSLLDRERLRAQLVRHEGERLRAYVDTVGKLTIGCGRNLEDPGISHDEAQYLLSNDIDVRVRALFTRYPTWFPQLDAVRQSVLVNMAFMGIAKLAGFRKMLAALERGDYDTAAEEMLDSLWARQVGARARELSTQMRTGQWA